MLNFQCLAAVPRIKVARTTIMKAGSHTHWSSLLMTAKPHLLKKALTPIGETSMGVHGKKNLVLSNGLNKAIPNPPLVNASSNP